MRRLTADLFGVRAGQVYPETIPAGAECPPEMIEAAEALGVLEPTPQRKARKRAPENKAAE